MDQLRNKSKHLGFTTLELMIGIGLTAAIVLVSVIGLRKMASAIRVESIKTDIITRHRDAKNVIANDLKHAQKIQGSTSGGGDLSYFAVSRTDPDKWTTNDQKPTANDTLQLYKEVFPELAGRAFVGKGGSTSTLLFGYVLESSDAANPSDRDLYFKSAFQHEKFFFFSNSDYRNIIQRTGGSNTSGAPCPTTSCLTDNCPTGLCYTFWGTIMKSDGTFADPIRDLVKVGEFARVDTNIRVGELIRYFVSDSVVAAKRWSSSTCPKNSLCRRTITYSGQRDQIILPEVKLFQIFYSFDPPSSDTTMPDNLIRSTLDTDYKADVASKTKRGVSYRDVSTVSLSIKEDLPEELATLLGPNANDAAFQADGAGGFDYTSMMRIRPGRGIEGSAGYDIKWGEDSNCPTLRQSQCNPSGKCNYLFTNLDPNSATSTKFQYHKDDPYCQCGWHGEESPAQFYDPADPVYFLKIPFLNSTVKKAYALPAPNDKIPVDPDAANACAKYYKCADPDAPTNYYMDQRHPLCPFVRQCIRSEHQADVWNSATGFDTETLATYLSTHKGDHHYLFCHNNSEGHGCDDLYDLSQNTTPMSGGSTFFQKTCACTVREWQRYNPDTLAWDRSTAVDMPWENLDFDSLCHMPNSFAARAGFACNMTWDDNPLPSGKAWRAQDDTWNEALPMRLAQLCACRRNHDPDGSPPDAALTPPIYPAFPYGASYAGDNKVRDANGKGWGWNDTWASYDWQYRAPNSIFDFRIDNPRIDGRMDAGQPGQYENPWNPIANPSATPTPSSAVLDPTPLPPPTTSDKSVSYWFACGETGPTDGFNITTNPKCLSYKSQWAYARINAGGTILGKNIDCSREQYAMSKGRFRSPGACLETSHVEPAPPNFPGAISVNETLFKYRFYCDPDCGAGPYQDFDAQFTNEVNYVRSLIRARVGETNDRAAWCPTLAPAPNTPKDVGEGTSLQPTMGGTLWP